MTSSLNPPVGSFVYIDNLVNGAKANGVIVPSGVKLHDLIYGQLEWDRAYLHNRSGHGQRVAVGDEWWGSGDDREHVQHHQLGPLPRSAAQQRLASSP